MAQKPGDAADPEDEPKDRFVIVALVAAAYVIWQMDKVNLSVAIIPMAAQYTWDSAEVGFIQSSLFWGYAATTILGGILAKQYGGKTMLLTAVTLFSSGTLLGPLAASFSTEAFILTRILVGVGEGLAPGAALTVIAAWVPPSERSRAVASIGSGKNAGSIIGLLLAPLVIGAMGWPALFYSFGSLGILWAATWAVLGQDPPAPSVSVKEPEDTPIPWWQIITTPQVWGVIAAHFGHDWGGYALLTWTPRYLNQVLGYDLQGSSQLTILPGVCAVGVAAVGSTIADSLVKDGMDLTATRKLAQGLGFIVPCICIGILATLGDIEAGSPVPIVLLIAGVASGALSYSGLYASHADLNKKYSGIVSGISTTFGALAGVGSNAFAGYVLKETGSWAQAIFLPTVAFYLIGFIVYQLLYDATPVDWDAQARRGSGANDEGRVGEEDTPR